MIKHFLNSFLNFFNVNKNIQGNIGVDSQESILNIQKTINNIQEIIKDVPLSIKEDIKENIQEDSTHNKISLNDTEPLTTYTSIEHESFDKDSFYHTQTLLDHPHPVYVMSFDEHDIPSFINSFNSIFNIPAFQKEKLKLNVISNNSEITPQKSTANLRIIDNE